MKQTSTHFFFFFIIMCIGFSSFAQNYSEPCGFDKISNNKQSYLINKLIMRAAKHITKAAGHQKVIPIVVHVIHNGGPENISEAQILSQIDVLNEDFGKLPSSPGDGNGVDTEIKFCLAKIDPNGNCTNGIVRVKSALTAHQQYQRAMLKELSFWDNTKYLNIYVVNSINGSVGGYASFPGGPADEDGIVVRDDLFGRMGTAGSQTGRTTTHEIGHWLGLYHTFNNGCGVDVCSDGDYVCDTPPVNLPNYTCNLNANSCSNDTPNVNDLVRNYMDYTPGTCQNMFTQGQKDRMQGSLDSIRTVIWTQNNLVATGCDSLYSPPFVCFAVANFVSLTPTICQGNAVEFTSISLNSIDSLKWLFIGGDIASSTFENPVVSYANIGSYDVSLIVFDGAYSDTLTKANYINVTTPGVGDVLSFGQNFDVNAFSDITITNPDGGLTWTLDSAASTSGKYSLRFDNLTSTNYGTTDAIEMPFLDFTTADPNEDIVMTFNFAYARSSPTFSDRMLVEISTDCGVNYTVLKNRTHANLATGPTQQTPFIPDSSQWRDEDINLNNYRNESYVKIRIVNETDGGNYLYIDDIYIGDNKQPITGTYSVIANNAEYTLFPNPSNGSTNLKYTGDYRGNVILTVFDMFGKVVYTKTDNLSKNDHLKINAEHLASGLYNIQIKTTDNIINVKWLVK